MIHCRAEELPVRVFGRHLGAAAAGGRHAVLPAQSLLRVRESEARRDARQSRHLLVHSSSFDVDISLYMCLAACSRAPPKAFPSHTCCDPAAPEMRLSHTGSTWFQDGGE